MKNLIFLSLIILLTGCMEDEDPGKSFSCIEPPDGAFIPDNINLAVYQNLANKDGFLNQISDTYIKVNEEWLEMTHWSWLNFPMNADIAAFKFTVNNTTFVVEKNHFRFNQTELTDFDKGKFTFDVFMNNFSREIIESDLYLNIWEYTGECNDLIKIID